MQDIQTYYIDKNKHCKYSNEITVIPEYPIITDLDDHKIFLKLNNFKILNNIFNISTNLLNNQFNIRRTSKTFSFTYGSELYLTDTGFFDDQNALLVNEVIDVTLHKSTISYDNTSLTYYNTADITDDSANYWQNILNDTPDITRKMKLHDTYIFFIEIECTDKTITSFDCVFYKDSYVGGSSTAIDLILQKYNESTTIWDVINTNTITFANSVPQEQISSSFSISSPSANAKYRITSNTAVIPFTLYILKLQADKQIPIFDTGTLDSPVEHTITIPDGFYKSSNFVKTLNDLLVNYKLKTSINEYTNKFKITNENLSFIPTVDTLIDNNFLLDLVLPNVPGMLENFGITLSSYQPYIPIPFNSYYESDSYINLINFNKLIITTNLVFKNKTHNDIMNVNPYSKSFGNILAWIDTDQIPFTYINYRNYENIEHEIVNSHINHIIFKFYNERSQEIFLDTCLLNFQIIKRPKK